MENNMKNCSTKIPHIVVGVLFVLVFVVPVFMYGPLADDKLRGKMVCEYRLKNVMDSLNKYARNHNSKFPFSLSGLRNDEKGSRLVCCPSTNIEYIYINNLTMLSPPETIILMCPLKSHCGLGGFIVTVNGKIRWHDNPGFTSIMQNVSSNKNGIGVGVSVQGDSGQEIEGKPLESGTKSE